MGLLVCLLQKTEEKRVVRCWAFSGGNGGGGGGFSWKSKTLIKVIIIPPVILVMVLMVLFERSFPMVITTITITTETSRETPENRCHR